jgi:hypothetical protein
MNGHNIARPLPVLALALLSGCALMSDSVGEKYSMTLTGGREVPGPGDRDGSGIADIIVDSHAPQICFSLEVEDIEAATAAHIHRGRVGEAGPPVVTLEPPGDGDSEGCLLIDRAITKEINAAPANFYVNVHNDEFPNGALRGQFERR